MSEWLSHWPPMPASRARTRIPSSDVSHDVETPRNAAVAAPAASRCSDVAVGSPSSTAAGAKLAVLNRDSARRARRRGGVRAASSPPTGRAERGAAPGATASSASPPPAVAAGRGRRRWVAERPRPAPPPCPFPCLRPASAATVAASAAGTAPVHSPVPADGSRAVHRGGDASARRGAADAPSVLPSGEFLAGCSS